MKIIQWRDFDAAQLRRWKALQREVFAVLHDEIAPSLRVGDSEQEVARRIHVALRRLGARSYFHVPVALFGERTAYPGDFGSLGALATERRLAAGEAVILDAAPLIDGYVVDCSLAVPRHDGQRSVFASCDQLLAELRQQILAGAKARANMREVARQVDAVIAARGFSNCHRKHIGQVLGHRAVYAPWAALARQRVWGLSPLPVLWFFSRAFQAGRGAAAATPNWNHTRQSDAAMQPGLWCVEPHVAWGATGVKFEELLVVTERDAYYLDDELPHHRRWADAAVLAQASR